MEINLGSIVQNIEFIRELAKKKCEGTESFTLLKVLRLCETEFQDYVSLHTKKRHELGLTDELIRKKIEDQTPEERQLFKEAEPNFIEEMNTILNETKITLPIENKISIVKFKDESFTAEQIARLEWLLSE